jgi:hypothetical protein
MEWDEETERQWVDEMVEKLQSEPMSILQLGLKMLLVAVIVFVLEGLVLAGAFAIFNLLHR